MAWHRTLMPQEPEPDASAGLPRTPQLMGAHDCPGVTGSLMSAIAKLPFPPASGWKKKKKKTA